ncbi:MAG TPA: DUF1772 domain-containing protein [Opitutales bacterium]|nr:DUF1772 domain-containing protein [Opitutales bacterium]
MNVLFNSLLSFATLSTLLVAGIVFTFSTIIMPGIGKLEDHGFIRAFQVIDSIIQNGQPLFGLVWVGSIISLFSASILGLWQLDGFAKWLLLTATLIYVVCVQVPTFSTNVPLNNELQAVNVIDRGATELKEARQRFEARWNRSNDFRSIEIQSMNVGASEDAEDRCIR